MKYFGWIFLFFIVLYIIPLGSRPFLTEEFQHAETAVQMLDSGNYLVPELFGEPTGEYPMTYWITAGCFKLFGINDFSARLPSAAAAGILSLLLASMVNQTTRDEKLASLSAMIFMSFSLVIFQAATAGTEIIFVMLVSGSLGAFFLALQEQKFNRRKVMLLIFSGLMTAAAFLTSGYTAFTLPALIIIAYALLNKEVKKLFSALPIYLPSAILVLLPWLYRIYRLRPDFLRKVMTMQEIQSAIGTVPWYSYIMVFLIGLIPVIILIPSALMTGRESWKRLMHLPLCKFLMCSMLLPLLYFSIFRNAPPGLMLIAFPALSLLIPLGMQAYFNNGGHHRSYDWMLNIWGLLLLVSGIIEAALWFLRREVYTGFDYIPLTPVFLMVLGISSIIGGGVILYSCIHGNWRSRLYLFFFTVALLPLGISWCILPNRAMPEKFFHDFMSEGELLPEKCTIITSKPLAAGVSWSTRCRNVIIAEPDREFPMLPDKRRCVILDVDDPLWEKLPSPVKTISRDNLLCAFFKN